MGICQSTALKIIVIDPEGTKETHSFSMKQMRTFQSMGDVLIRVGIDLQPNDKIYARSPVGLEDVPTHSQFQIRDLVVKNKGRNLKYQIRMESLY